jgi:hypothetical protein
MRWVAHLLFFRHSHGGMGCRRGACWRTPTSSRANTSWGFLCRTTWQTALRWRVPNKDLDRFTGASAPLLGTWATSTPI